MARYDILDRPISVRHLGFAIPLKNRRREFERDNVLLLGDAAGFAESFYGEGIYFALRSSLAAAEAFTVAFERPSDRAYSHLVASCIQPELTYSALNARMFFRAQKLAFHAMVTNEHINDYYAELIAGGVSHRSCFYKTIFTSPYWLFSRRLQPVPEASF
jgi:flavin-dependent dehydrogenase